MKESVPFLKLALVKPPGKSDKAIVAEVEEMAVELAGPYLLKEHESLHACCSSGSRVNRSFAVMGVRYPDRVEPKKPEKRSKGTSSEDPATKKKKVSFADAEASKAYPKVLSAKPPRPPPKVPSAKKGNRLVRYLRDVPPREMCSESFLRQLEETVSYSPLREESMELYFDQFGSLLSGPDSVGDVVVKLNPSRGVGLRSVSLLDLDDEGTTINPVLSTPGADVEPARPR